MNKLLVILGSTATRKTDLALFLAKIFNGELISCDSRQVYRGLDIGTGKYPNSKFQITKSKGFWEIGRIKVWMYDVVNPIKQYTVYNYIKDANRVVREVRIRGKLPIVVGGTGLYLKALLEGLSNLAIPVDIKLRKKLEKLSLSLLQNKLQKLSLKKWEKMNQSDRQNPRRLVRAIELILVKTSSRLKNYDLGFKDLDVLKIGLTIPRQILYQRADDRVVSRVNQGMIDEAKKLYKNGLSLKRMKQLGLEYGILADYLSGKIREIKGDQGLIKIMQNKIHGFIKRQLTWFKKEKDVVWFDIISKNYPANVENLVTRWYHRA